MRLPFNIFILIFILCNSFAVAQNSQSQKSGVRYKQAGFYFPKDLFGYKRTSVIDKEGMFKATYSKKIKKQVHTFTFFIEKNDILSDKDIHRWHQKVCNTIGMNRKNFNTAEHKLERMMDSSDVLMACKTRMVSNKRQKTILSFACGRLNYSIKLLSAEYGLQEHKDLLQLLITEYSPFAVARINSIRPNIHLELSPILMNAGTFSPHILSAMIDAKEMMEKTTTSFEQKTALPFYNYRVVSKYYMRVINGIRPEHLNVLPKQEKNVLEALKEIKEQQLLDQYILEKYWGLLILIPETDSKQRTKWAEYKKNLSQDIFDFSLGTFYHQE